ncbi:PAS domain S-box protein [Magnetospirillum sp. SS-4]|uniref:PAS domain S-box protein n=1 Tax=Magnetospirillum sp. SS-4 TaxID=2681465 RepID=UPI001572B6FB|nr:PAS domain S-box protein [Magnetospirillum sp. SS-4]
MADSFDPQRPDIAGIERFFQLSSDLLCVADPEGRFLRLSESWSRLLGYETGELMSRPFMDFIHSDDHAATAAVLGGLRNGRPVVDFVNRYRTRGGDYRHLCWRSTPADEDGLIFAVARDVTDDMLQRQRMERQERQLAEAMRLGRLGFWDLEIASGSLFWSSQIFALFGLDPAGLSPSYDAFLDMIHPDDREAVNRAYRVSVAERTPYSIRHRLRWKDGTVRWVEERGETIYAGDGTPLRSIGTVQDVTEETLSRQHLAAEQTRLRAIMDTIPDLVFIKDSQFRYIGCNRPFEEFAGRSEAEMLNRDDFDLFAPETARFFRDHDIAMFRTGAAHRNEEWVTYPDGRRFLLDTMKVPFHDQSGHVVGLVGISRDITEQARLRGEVDFLGTLVNRSADPIYCIAPDRGFALVYVNDAACALAGTGRNDLIGAAMSRFDPMMTDEWLSALWRRIRGTTTPEVIAASFHRADGTVVPVEISTSHIRHDDEDYIAGWIQDISARRAAERALREREALYRASIEASADGFWQVDQTGRILNANSTYAAMSGYSLDELRGMAIPDLEAMESEADTTARMERIRAAGSVTFESRHRRKDGSIWDVEVTCLYSDVEGGRYFAFLRDLRRRHRADSLLKARLHLSEVGRSGDIGVLMTEVLDTAERLTASTIGFLHLVSPDQASLTLQAWSSNTLAHMCKAEGQGLHYPVDEAGTWADCLRQGRAVICNDYPALPGKRGLPEGHAPITRMLSVPVPGEHGFAAIIGVGNKAADYDQDDLDIVAELASIAMDIFNWVKAEQAQKAQERQMQRTIADLTDSNAELERFAQIAAHDLQEPTRRQVLFAQLLRRKLENRIDEETGSYLGFIVDDALRMRAMVQDLAAYSETGRSARPRERVDLDRVMQDVANALGQEIAASGARLSGTSLGEVSGYRSRLQLLLVNLVSNSLRFRHPERPPCIKVTARPEGGWLELAVADNGIGIPEQYRADLFSVFRRLVPQQQQAGTGMGLAQCRRIVEDLGGRIWIEGNGDGGTTVKLTLPRAD